MESSQKTREEGGKKRWMPVGSNMSDVIEELDRKEKGINRHIPTR